VVSRGDRGPRTLEDLFSLLEEALLKLNAILEKLTSLEERLSLGDVGSGEVRIAIEMASALSLPLIRALEYARRAWSIISGMATLDPISQAIVEVLSTCRGMRAIEIYRGVRQLRGRGSRRIVAERLKALETMGIVSRVGSEKRPKYTLRACLEERGGRQRVSS